MAREIFKKDQAAHEPSQPGKAKIENACCCGQAGNFKRTAEQPARSFEGGQERPVEHSY